MAQYKLKAMPDCSFKYLCGINQELQSSKELKKVLLAAFNQGFGAIWDCPPKLPGAIMFSGAYGGDTFPAFQMEGYGVTDKVTVLKNLENVCKFFEEEECGEIVIIPEFKNELHNSTISPIMLQINAKKFKKALRRWNSEKLNKQDTKEMW